MLSPFPVSLLPRNPLSLPPASRFYEGIPLTTHPLLPPHPQFPYTGDSIKSAEFQGPLLPLVHDKAILCYICSKSHVYSFVDLEQL